ncbi:hypothetical protein Hanom_Chr08g00705431 [Helianthus anomalus]
MLSQFHPKFSPKFDPASNFNSPLIDFSSMNLFHFHQKFPSQSIPLPISILNDFLFLPARINRCTN